MSAELNEPGPRRVGRVLVYPNRGRLLFATDFHGQLEDFRRVVAEYRGRRAGGEDVYLLFAGDFVHGPDYDGPEDFPDYLGDYHTDGTVDILAELGDLMASDPRVSSLLGNHEHAHIGGPPTSKFHQDPNEVDFLERALGPDRTAAAHALFGRFALVALTPCGVLFTHGAPNVATAGFDDLSDAALTGFERRLVLDMYKVSGLGELLWSRCAAAHVADAFFERMAFDGIRPRVGVFGHDIVREGYCVDAPNQLCVSTSFGLKRGAKTLLEVDLAANYDSADALVAAGTLRPLYPSA